MKKSGSGALMVVAVLLMAGQASAGLIGVTRVDPDISSVVVSVSYDESDDLFAASGTAVTLTTADETVYAIADGTFDLQATIDGSGVASGGTLDIGGTISALGYTSGTLLTGSLVAYGTDGSQTFDFLWTPTGGAAVGLFNPQAGTILNAGSLAPGLDWTQDFANDGFSGTADTVWVPEPATVALLGAGGLLFAVRRRR